MTKDDRFAKLYVKPRNRQSGKTPDFKEEQDLTETVQVSVVPSPPSSFPSSIPRPLTPFSFLNTNSPMTSTPSSFQSPGSSFLKSSQQAPSSAQRRSPRLSVEPSPRKHTQLSSKGTPARKKLSNAKSSGGAFVNSSDEAELEHDELEDEGEEEVTTTKGDVDDDSGEGSHALSASPLKELVQPVQKALTALASPLKPALEAVSSRVQTELARAQTFVSGIEHGVEGAVSGVGYRVDEVVHAAEDRVGKTVHAAEDRAVRTKHAVERRGRKARQSVGDVVEGVQKAPVRLADTVRRALAHPESQTFLLLALEGLFLVASLLPYREHVVVFPPRLLSAVDKHTDFAHLYPTPTPWATLAVNVPTRPASYVSLSTAFFLWLAATVLAPLSLTKVVSNSPTDPNLVFWLLRLAVLALGHVGWRGEGWGSGNGRVGVVVSALGAGLGVARGLGEARVGGVAR